MSEKTKELTEATEVKEKKNEASVKNAKSIPVSDNPTMTAEDMAMVRNAQKEACSKEVNQILSKYGCDFAARILVTEDGNFPQVFIVDAKPRG